MEEFPNANGAGLNGLDSRFTEYLESIKPSKCYFANFCSKFYSVGTSKPPSSFFVESGSYLRLKMAQVGYTLPKIKGIRKLRVYAQAFNLLTITKYSGQDPEV